MIHWRSFSPIMPSALPIAGSAGSIGSIDNALSAIIVAISMMHSGNPSGNSVSGVLPLCVVVPCSIAGPMACVGRKFQWKVRALETIFRRCSPLHSRPMKLLPPPLPRQFGERWMGVRRISFISEVQHRRFRHMIGISADMAVCTDYAFSGHPVLNHPQLGHVVAVYACDACPDIVKVLAQMIRCNDRIKAQPCRYGFDI